MLFEDMAIAINPALSVPVNTSSCSFHLKHEEDFTKKNMQLVTNLWYLIPRLNRTSSVSISYKACVLTENSRLYSSDKWGLVHNSRSMRYVVQLHRILFSLVSIRYYYAWDATLTEFYWVNNCVFRVQLVKIQNWDGTVHRQRVVFILQCSI